MNPRPVVVIDAEWGYRGGRIGFESTWVPIVLCAVILFSGQEFVFLPGKGDAHLRAFFTEHSDSLFVAHSMSAEVKYLLRLGLPIPEHWFDTLLAERWLTNGPNRQPVGLADALERRGLKNQVRPDKSDFRQKLLTLDFRTDDASFMTDVAQYCLRDCHGCAALFNLQTLDPEIFDKLSSLMSWHPHYLIATSKMELRGITIDMGNYRQIVEHWSAIREAFIADINAVAPVMDPSGLNRGKFARWCKANGVKLPTVFDNISRKRRYSISNDALKEIEHLHPLIPLIRQTQKSLVAIRNNTMVVDPIAVSHYFDIMPFGTLTGRNAPKRFIFNQSKWMRFLIVPKSPEHVLVYVDYTAQEIGIAAALSQDPEMIAMYHTDDPHMYFAELAGAVPGGAEKTDYPDIRRKYKTVNLGVLYGLTPKGTTDKLGITFAEAEELHQSHHRLFPTFWEWSERKIVTAFARGSIRTRLGWRCRVPPDSNERTWANWPMQATGGDIMRLTVMYMDKADLELLAPVHDGFLLSCRRDELDALQAKVAYACSSAVRHVLGDFELKWTIETHEERFTDPDGLQLWERVRRFIEGTHHE